jgi:undecaprenyl-diphosphatase
MRRRGLRALYEWLNLHELGSALAVVSLALGVLVFLAVFREVNAGDLAAFDRATLLAFREPGRLGDPIGPRWVEDMGRDVTALGSVAVLTLLTLFATGYLLLVRKPRAAAFIVGSVIAGAALSSALKGVIGRPRPDLVPHLAYVTTSSFPSGHSMVSASVYLTLGALMARFESHLVLKAYVMLSAVGLSFLVGVSRVYAGVHWPSDVVAGWAAGTAWASASWIVARKFQRKGAVEKSPPAD